MLFFLDKPIIEGLKKLKIKKPKAPNFGKIIRDIGNLGKKINSAFKKIGSIEKKIQNVFKIIPAVFKQIPKVLNDALVKPLKALFLGIGSIFTNIFAILQKIGYKISGLPGCILYYVIYGITNSVTGFLSWLTPNWIERPVSRIWNATFGRILSWILNFTGYTKASRKCIGFNVNEQINNMNKAGENIKKAFTKDFGKNIKFKIPKI